MNVWERIRHFWGASSEPDHPLSEQEREEQPPGSAHDELAQAAGEYLGGRDDSADEADAR